MRCGSLKIIVVWIIRFGASASVLSNCLRVCLNSGLRDDECNTVGLVIMALIVM